jgi:hypothetical protein
MPPPSAPEQPGNHFGDVPTFQPPTAHGGKRKVELRPYTVADILDLTFQLMKSNWKKLAIATLVFALPAGIISAISDAARNVGGSGSEIFFGNSFSFYGRFGADSSLSGGRLAIVGICGVLSLLISLLLQPLVQGAITRLVAANFVGRDMGPKEAFDGVKSMWLTFVGASILVPLATLGGLLGLIVGALAVWVLFTAVIPIIAIEEEGVFNAMGRSWALMKRGFWRYLGTLLALFVVRFLISIAVILIPGGIALILYSANLDAVAVVFGAAAAVLSSLVVFPIAAIAATLIYFDASVRFEGFDVQLMAARLPQSSAPTYGSGNL